MRPLYILIIILIIQIQYGNAYSSSEIRAYWVVRYALKDSAEIDRVVRTAFENNMTDIFVQVRAKGETYFESGIENRTKQLKNDFDPLAYIIRRSQMYGIRVHAWINMFFVWYGSAPPADSAHSRGYALRAPQAEAGDHCTMR